MEGEARRPARRRRSRWRRRARLLVPLAILAAAAVAVVLVIRGGAGPRRAATSSPATCAPGPPRDYHKMYSLLDPGLAQRDRAKRGSPPPTGATRRSATVKSITPVRVGSRGGEQIPVRMVVATRLFGTLRETVQVPLAGSGSSATVRFVPSLLFPGLRGRERLGRHMSLAPRATLFAADGTPARAGPGPDLADLRRGDPDRRRARPDPVRPGGHVRRPGLSRPTPRWGWTDSSAPSSPRWPGRRAASLLAGHRVLAHRDPKPGHDVTTTIDPTIERAAVAALGGRYGGIAAMNPRTGALLALAGVAFSALQPPGSTMKIITTTGALEAGIVKLSDTFPIATSATIEGYTLHNAGGEACGGTLLNAFAVSCNSVFAPLGAKLGAKRLVDVAERFGFNQPPDDPRRGRADDPVRERDRRRPRGRLLGDRAGPGPGDRARDDRRRGDDRDGRPAAAAHPPGPRARRGSCTSPTGTSRACSSG